MRSTSTVPSSSAKRCRGRGPSRLAQRDGADVGFAADGGGSRTAAGQWTFAQWARRHRSPRCSCSGPLAGLIAEPSFDFGDGAVTEQVLGVDFNGVHALSGFLLFLPAYYFALRPNGRSTTRSTSPPPST